MLFTIIIVVVASVVCTLATPLNLTSMQPLVLEMRGAPSVKKNDYTEQQIQQIKEGHLDAIKLASMVVSQSQKLNTFDPIFRNYFRLSDRDTVINVFKQIVGPKDLRYGNSLLADITVVKVSKQKDGQLSCNDPKVDSELLETDTDKPKLVVCPRAFTRGAFSGKGYPGAPVVTCDRCYPRISKKMDTIGMILLDEYTHWDKLMSPALPPGFSATSTSDYCYGPFRTRLENKFIAPDLAIWNGDSYAWLANEIWWTQACVSSHGALTAPLRSDN